MGVRNTTRSRSAQRPEPLPLGSTEPRQEQDLLLTQVLLMGNTGGDAVTWAFARFAPQTAFRVLRLFSGLRIHLTRDLGAISLACEGNMGVLNRDSEGSGSAGISRWLMFPDFRDVLGTLERVQCHLLCRQIASKREVADRLGWSEDAVRRADDAIRKRLRGLKGLAW